MPPILPTNVSLPAILPPAPVAPQAIPTGGSSFQSVFADAVSKVESFQNNAQQSVERFLSGEGEELHTTIMATQRAELGFELFLQARNKVVSAYQEIMRMQM